MPRDTQITQIYDRHDRKARVGSPNAAVEIHEFACRLGARLTVTMTTISAWRITRITNKHAVVKMIAWSRV